MILPRYDESYKYDPIGTEEFFFKSADKSQNFRHNKLDFRMA